MTKLNDMQQRLYPPLHVVENKSAVKSWRVRCQMSQRNQNPVPPATSVGRSTRTARAECSTKVIDTAANVLKQQPKFDTDNGILSGAHRFAIVFSALCKEKTSSKNCRYWRKHLEGERCARSGFRVGTSYMAQPAERAAITTEAFLS